jgi:predicted O-methyltransferase YrrM
MGKTVRERRLGLRPLLSRFARRHLVTGRPEASPIAVSDDPELLIPGLYDRTVTLGCCRWRWGHPCNDQALLFLCHLAALSPGPIVEFGTFDGRTTYNLALNAAPGVDVLTLDAGIECDESNVEGKAYGSFVPGACFRDAPAAIRNRIRLVQADSRQVDLSDLYGLAGLVIVDGGHGRDVCLNDTVAALRLVRLGGTVVWDDYTPYWPGVKETLDALVRHVPLTHYPRLGHVVFVNRGVGGQRLELAEAARAMAASGRTG